MKIASSDTKLGLQSLINEFYFSESYVIREDNLLDNEKLSDEKLERINHLVKVEKIRDRWVFSKR